MDNRKPLPGELGFSLIFVSLSIFIVISALYILKADITLSSPGAFPVFVSMIMLITSILIYKEIKKNYKDEVRASFKKTMTLLFNKDVLGMIIFILIYTLVLSIAGFKITTLLFLWGSMIFLKVGNWKKTLIISISTVVIIILIFSFVFKVILP